jgi:hypothetical protein
MVVVGRALDDGAARTGASSVDATALGSAVLLGATATVVDAWAQPLKIRPDTATAST